METSNSKSCGSCRYAMSPIQGDCGSCVQRSGKPNWRSKEIKCPGCDASEGERHIPGCPEVARMISETPADPDRGAPLSRLKLTPPDTNPKTRFGMAKTPMSLIPAAAKVLIAESFRLGAEKYGPANWRVSPVSASTYLNAAERHMACWIDGEELDPESGVSHLAHAAACMCILMDAKAHGTLLDDRPPPADTAGLIRSLVKPII